MWELLQQITIYSFIFGSIYLLISLGFSLICGVLRVFHLGYGATFILTVYLTWMFMTELRLSFLSSVLLMIALQFLLIVLMNKGIFQRFMEEEEKILTLSLLVFLVFQNLFNLLYPITVGVNIPSTIIRGPINIGTVTVPGQMLVAAFVGIIVTVLYVILFLRTKLGLMARGISQNLRGSMLMGIDVNKIGYISVILSVIPPIICTLMIAPFWSIEPFMGTPMLSIAMLISILGGLGNLKGSMVASYIIGFVHSLVAFTISPRFMSLAALIIVVITLVVKSEGLMGAERLW